MPEYLAPGVYVEEYDADPQPIPGVSTSIDDAMARGLIERFEDLLPPDWTGFNESDPGVTLANLFSFLTENLLYQSNAETDARHKAAVREVLLALWCGPLVRPRYFEGERLDASTLEAEQNYHRNVLRRHNLALHGFGVVSGLGVHVEEGGNGPRVVLDPGYAIDPRGEELAVSKRAVLCLPTTASEAFVSLRRWDRPCEPAATLRGGAEPTRIEEASIIAVSARILLGALALARLERGAAGWSADPSFAAPLVSSWSGLLPRVGALKTLHFRLQIDGVVAAEFSEMAIGSMVVEASDYCGDTESSRVLKLGGLNKTGDITLKRGVVRSRDNGFQDFATGRLAGRHSVMITIVDEIGNERAQFDINDAWPKKYDPSDLDGEGNDACIEMLELGNEGIKRVG